MADEVFRYPIPVVADTALESLRSVVPARRLRVSALTEWDKPVLQSVLSVHGRG